LLDSIFNRSTRPIGSLTHRGSLGGWNATKDLHEISGFALFPEIVRLHKPNLRLGSQPIYLEGKLRRKTLERGYEVLRRWGIIASHFGLRRT
jgi:hypothetical protein